MHHIPLKRLQEPRCMKSSKHETALTEKFSIKQIELENHKNAEPIWSYSFLLTSILHQSYCKRSSLL